MAVQGITAKAKKLPKQSAELKGALLPTLLPMLVLYASAERETQKSAILSSPERCLCGR